MNKTITAAGAPAAVGALLPCQAGGGHLVLLRPAGIGARHREVRRGSEKPRSPSGPGQLGRGAPRAAGMDYADVVETTVFLADINDFAAVNAIYAEYFRDEPPARSCVQAGALPKDGLFEIEAVAVK